MTRETSAHSTGVLLAQGCCAKCGEPCTSPPNSPTFFHSLTTEYHREVDISPRLRISPSKVEMHIQSEIKNMSEGEIGLGKTEELIETHLTESKAEIQQEIVNFTDNKRGEFLDISTNTGYTRGDDSQSVELNNFLKRPVKIATYTWAEGASIPRTNQFYPWYLYFNNPQIKKKLDNYYLLRCNLKLKVVINASPFYYGCGFLAYQPLYAFETNWDASSNPDYFDDILISQKPIAYFYPQTNSGCEMTLPWCYHQEWVDATWRQGLEGLGRCCLSSFGILRNANSVVGSSVEITVYAWAEDVQMAGPTQALSIQSAIEKKSENDEYDGVISKPASAIARAAGHLEDVPIIGPFATATGAIASKVGSFAKLFGFSRVPTTEDVHPYRSKTHPNLANTDVAEVIDKLTFDSKNELSIDPKICGVPLSDEMDISSFVKRESLFSVTTWESTYTPGQWLRVFRINPSMRQFTARTNENLTIFTPMSYVSQMFEYWRGDIIVKLKVICSPYHKGRLEIIWDPRAPLNTLADSSMVNYTHILDISEETELELRIPYTQQTAYSLTNRSRTATFLNSTPFSPILNSDNGTLGIRVLNRLTSPVATADINVLVYVRGDDNLEFAGPIDLPLEISPYQIQSTIRDLSKDKEDKVYDLGIQSSSTYPQINLVYHGETIKTFRTLMQRMNNYFAYYPPTGSTSTEDVVTITSLLPRMLLYPGYDPNGVHVATGINSGVNEFYNFVGWHPVNWLALAFVGNRGSMVYTISALSEKSSTVEISRKPDLTLSRVQDVVTFAATSISNSARDFLNWVGCGNAGLTLTNTSTQSTVTAAIPMYSHYKMMSNNPLVRTFGVSTDGSNSDAINIQCTTRGDGVDTYPAGMRVQACAGVDFSLLFFSGLQPMYWYSAYPSAP